MKNQFELYQPFLSDQQVDEVNSGQNPHKDFTRLMFVTSEFAWEGIQAAFGYYRHTATVQAESPEDVFYLSNIGDVDPFEYHSKNRSVSVGDIVINMRLSLGWICLPVGWHQLERNKVHEFQAEVSTFMKMGEKIEL